MNISLDVVDMGGGKVTAHAATTKDDGAPHKGVSVTFRVNGKSVGRPVRVDDDGVASLELNLKAGTEHRVMAMVVGSPHVADSDTITPTVKKERKTNWLEWAISAIFLLSVLTFGYTTLTVLGLIVTVSVLVLTSRVKETSFLGLLGNNNWVFGLMRGLMLFSLAMWIITLETSDLNPVKHIWEGVKSIGAPTDPWADEGTFLLGTGTWWGAFLSFALFTVISYPVSYWDEWIAKVKKAGSGAAEKGGLLQFLVRVFVHEGLGELLWSPFKKKH